MLASPYLSDDGPRYERATHGWVDVLAEETLVMTVRITDPWVGVELVVETLPSPTYRIVRAEGRVLVGGPERVAPELAGAMSGIAGLAMVSGFTREVARVAGVRAGGGYFVDSAIEVARLARQVTRLPHSEVAEELRRGAVGAWRLDTRGWVDIPGSCYTYRPESEQLFAERPVTASSLAVLYAPRPGTRGVFNRTRIARIDRRPDAWHLSHAMFDEVHSFHVWIDIEPGAARVVDAGSTTPQLPYGGICTDPQTRVKDLIGQPVDAGLRKRLPALVGGPMGCTQLFDLTADLLKLLTLA